MNILRRTVMAIGGMTVVALVIALAAPKTAHALVATLVRDVDNPARHPFQATCNFFESTRTAASCFVTTVPVGQAVRRLMTHNS